MCHVRRQTQVAYKVLVGRNETKRSLGRSSRIWEYNIKIRLHQVGWIGVDWFDMAEDSDSWWSVVNAAMNFRVP